MKVSRGVLRELHVRVKEEREGEKKRFAGHAVASERNSCLVFPFGKR